MNLLQLVFIPMILGTFIQIGLYFKTKITVWTVLLSLALGLFVTILFFQAQNNFYISDFFYPRDGLSYYLQIIISLALFIAVINFSNKTDLRSEKQIAMDTFKAIFDSIEKTNDDCLTKDQIAELIEDPEIHGFKDHVEYTKQIGDRYSILLHAKDHNEKKACFLLELRKNGDLAASWNSTGGFIDWAQ